MKSKFYFVSIIVLVFSSRCSYDQENIGYTNTPPLSDPCFENEEQILNQPGSNDAPFLSIGIGIETGIIRLSWTSLPGVDFYVLEECNCPDFDFGVYEYTLFENDYWPVLNRGTFYRVRASLSSWSTGWSNVVKNNF